MRPGLQTAALILSIVPVVIGVLACVAIPLKWTLFLYLDDYAVAPGLLCWGASAVILAAQYWDERSRTTNTSLVTLIPVGPAPLLVFVPAFIWALGGLVD
jgi:hypothetical protein